MWSEFAPICNPYSNAKRPFRLVNYITPAGNTSSPEQTRATMEIDADCKVVKRPVPAGTEAMGKARPVASRPHRRDRPPGKAGRLDVNCGLALIAMGRRNCAIR